MPSQMMMKWKILYPFREKMEVQEEYFEYYDNV